MEYDILNDLLGKTVQNLFQKKTQGEDTMRNFLLMLSAEKKMIRTIEQHQQMRNLKNQDQFMGGMNQQMNNFNQFPQQQPVMRSIQFTKKQQVNDNRKVTQSVEYGPNTNIKDNYQKKKQTPTQQQFNKEKQQQKYKEDEPKTEKEKIAEWIKEEANKRLAESLQRLDIDFKKITKHDLERMSSNALQYEKRNVKNELKRYDQGFKRIFGRIPVRQEKEPMRPLYIYYKTLKQKITEKQKQSRHQQQQQKTYGQPKTSQSMEFKKKQKNNKVQKKQSLSYENFSLDQKLDELRNERIKIRAKLQNYQKKFQDEHNRKIRYLADIEPVEQEYNRYREIKNEIQQIEALISKQRKSR